MGGRNMGGWKDESQNSRLRVVVRFEILDLKSVGKSDDFSSNRAATRLRVVNVFANARRQRGMLVGDELIYR
jgi:hypothetical protein